MLRNPPLHSPHELLLLSLSFHSLGQLLKPLMMVYGSKPQLAFKLALIGFQDSLGVVFYNPPWLPPKFSYASSHPCQKKMFSKKKVNFVQAKV